MKKLAVLSIALLMLTTLVFAVDVQPAVSFSGSGTLTWGIDLDNSANHGFQNTSSANLTVTLVPSSTESRGAEGETVYGAITLSGMSLIFNSDNNNTGVVADTTVITGALVAPTVEAWVMLGPAKWFIYPAPNLGLTFAAPVEDDPDGLAYWVEGDDADNVAPDFGTYGTGIQIAAGPATITALIASATDWTAGPAAYGAGLKVGLTAGPATINAAMNYPFDGGPLGAGVGVGLALGPAAVNLGFDLQTGTPLLWELAAGATVTLPDLLTAGLGVAFSETWGLDTEVKVTLTAVPNLDFMALLGLYNLDTDLTWGVKLAGGYKIGLEGSNYVKPALTTWIGTPAGGDLMVALEVSVTAVLIPNTTFKLAWTAHDLVPANGMGTLTFATTVAY